MRLPASIALSIACALFWPNPTVLPASSSSSTLIMAGNSSVLAKSNPYIVHNAKEIEPAGASKQTAKRKRATKQIPSQRKRIVLKRDKALARSIARSAAKQARRMRTKGFCYRGVKRAVAPLGIKLTGIAAYKAKKQLIANKKFRIVARKIVKEKLKRGDIVVHNRSTAHPYGHIAVYLGNGLEASDHIRRLVIGRSYGGTVVFRPVEQSTNS